MSKFFNPSNLKKKGVKELAVLLMSREFPLQLIEIKKKLKEEFSLDVSFQAVKKAVDSLEEEGIIRKEGKSFFLDKKWISESKKFFDALTSRNVSKIGTRKGTLGKPGNINTVFFSDLYSLDNFWADIMFDWLNKIEKGEEKISAGQCPFGWWVLINFASDTKLHNAYKKKGIKQFQIFTKDFPLNHFAAKNYEEMGVKSIVLKNRSFEYEKEFLAYGDYVIEVEYPKKTFKKIFDFYSKYDSFDRHAKKFQKIVKEKTKIKFTFFKDRFVAEKLRESVLREFRKK